MRERLAAARHETQCEECRSTWLSWTQRLLGIRRGYSPCNRRILHEVMRQRDEAREALQELVNVRGGREGTHVYRAVEHAKDVLDPRRVAHRAAVASRAQDVDHG